jgi:hypothetical protein
MALKFDLRLATPISRLQVSQWSVRADNSCLHSKLRLYRLHRDRQDLRSWHSAKMIKAAKSLMQRCRENVAAPETQDECVGEDGESTSVKESILFRDI